MQTDVIYTDFSKVFDRVNHCLLLKKLQLLGFNPKLLEWISSYLSDRFQKVVFNNELSDTLKVTSGVPQGSYLSPVLFNIFINDLPTVISHSSVLRYADDVKLFLSYSDYNCQRLLQEDLVALETCCEYNLMNLNLGKCKCMSFSEDLG